MTVKTSTFTSSAIAIFARWQVHPSEAKKFTKVSFGTLTDSQAEDQNLYTNSDIEHMHAEDSGGSVEDVTNPDDIIITAEEGSPVAKVKVSVTFSNDMRGKVVREVGLYINIGTVDDPSYTLMWIGRFPDSYIPRVEETGVAVTLNVTIPIKFNNDAIPGYIKTDNTSLSFKIDQVNARVDILNGEGEDEEKASQSDLESLGTEVDSKADQSDVDDLTAAVGAKADQSTVDALTITVSNKADQSALADKVDTSTFQVLEKRVNVLSGGSATTHPNPEKKKADDSDFQDYKTATNSTLSALSSADTQLSNNIQKLAGTSGMYEKANKSVVSNLSTTVGTLTTNVSTLTTRVNTLSGATLASQDKEKANASDVLNWFRQSTSGIYTLSTTGASGRGIAQDLPSKPDFDDVGMYQFTSMGDVTPDDPRSGCLIYYWPNATGEHIPTTVLDFNFYMQTTNENFITVVGHLIVYENASHKVQGFGSFSYRNFRAGKLYLFIKREYLSSLGAAAFTLRAEFRHALGTLATEGGALCYATRTRLGGE